MYPGWRGVGGKSNVGLSDWFLFLDPDGSRVLSIGHPFLCLGNRAIGSGGVGPSCMQISVGSKSEVRDPC